MSKDHLDRKTESREDTAARYVGARREAVDKLLDAQRGKVKSYSMEELGKYRGKKGLHVPAWLAVMFIKAWFAGAVCFFFFWGLGVYITSMLDMLFILGMALGFVTDLLTNNLLRFLEKTPGDNDRWMLFPPKYYFSLPLNVAYSYLILYLVYSSYNLINAGIVAATGQVGTVPLGVEPILFGILCMAFDLGCVGLKQVFKSILRDAKAKAGPPPEKKS